MNKRIQKNNKSGFKGVFYEGGKNQDGERNGWILIQVKRNQKALVLKNTEQKKQKD